MEYSVDAEGFEDGHLTVRTGGLFSGPRLLLNDQLAPKGQKRGEFLLTRGDGTEVVTCVRNTNTIDPVPQVIVEDKMIPIVEPLKWYQWI